MTASPVLGRPLWYELMTSDTSAAETFYKSVVGWSSAPFGDAGMPYTLWNRPDGAPMGGLMTLPDELRTAKVPPHWSMYVGVNKLEDGAARVKQLGGSVVSPVIDAERRAHADSEGSAGCGLHIYEPAAPRSRGGPPREETPPGSSSIRPTTRLR